MIACPECWTANAEEHRFCSACGAVLVRQERGKPASQAALPTQDVVRTYPEPPIPDERKLVTILFSDISGFTAMAETMDPEAVREVLNGCFECLVPVVEKYGGTVEKYIGDEIMAMFGAPVTHEDDAERALRSALEMMEAVGRFNAEWGTDLSLHFGINTGPVIAGGVGAGGHRQYAVTGDTVNVAARLEELSARGHILVGEATHDLTSRLFEFEPLEPVRAKGKTDPMPVYRLLRAKPVSAKALGERELRSCLVGRETEYRALQDAVERLRSGAGGIVTVLGDAGLGKSRLVADLKGQVLGEQAKCPPELSPGLERLPLQWVEGRGVSYGGSVAYLPWLEVLRGFLGVREDDPSPTVHRVLREQVELLCRDRFDDVFPCLARLMAMPLESEAEAVLRGLGSRGLKTATFRAVERFLEGATRQRGPLVVVCEDLHWSDPTSLELLTQLLSMIDRAPLLLICLFRPEREHGCWDFRETAARHYAHRHTDLWLAPLSTTHSEQLVNRLLHMEVLPPGLAERILAHAEGNPLYVEEMVRSLVTGGVMVWNEGLKTWQTAGSVADIGLPATLRGVLTARIDRLPSEAKRVLQVASVIGRVFEYRVLETLAPRGGALDGDLLVLQRADFIRERARIPEAEYIFKHQLTQEAAYESLLRKERRALHARVALALEDTFSGRVEEHLEVLAHHWEGAEQAEKAIDYWVRAGRQAARRYANLEALADFQRALVLAEGKEGYDEILGHRAKVLLDLFRGQEASYDYARLLERARRSGDRHGELEALLGLAAAYYAIALDRPETAPRSREHYEQAAQLAAELDHPVAMAQALIKTTWFTDYWPDYWDRAVAHVEQAWTLSQRTGDEDLILDCHIARANKDLVSIAQVEALLQQLQARHDLPRLKEAYFRLTWRHLLAGNFTRCVECCDAGMDLSTRLGMPPIMYSTMKALALLELGRYDTASHSLQQEVTHEAYPFAEALKSFGQGMVYLELMDYAEAASVFGNAVRQAKGVGRAWLQFWAEAGLSRALLRSGRLAEVNVDWTSGDLAHTGTALTAAASEVLGEMALLQGQPESALEHAKKACAESMARGWRPAYVSGLELQCRVLIRLKRPTDALVQANDGLREAEAMGQRQLTWRVGWVKAQALKLLGDAAGAARAYGDAVAVVRELAASVEEGPLRRRFMSNPLITSLLMGDGARD